MKHSTKKSLNILTVVASLTILGAAIGNGCGEAFSPIGSSSNSSKGPIDGGNNDGLNIVVNQKTAAVTNFTSAFDNMLSMTGVTPSNTTRTVFRANIGNFSETGGVLTINAPMLMAYVAVGAEVCNDFVTQENALTAANRRVFTQLDFAATNATVVRDADLTDAVVPAGISDTSRRLARLFWQRNETPAELAMINTGVQEILASAPALPTANIQRRVGLYICTSMISSTAGYQL